MLKMIQECTEELNRLDEEIKRLKLEYKYIRQLRTTLLTKPKSEDKKEN